MQLSQTQTHNLAGAVLMVAPADFVFNSETASDNQFMKNLGDVRDKALAEFNKSVQTLRSTGVQVIVFDKQKYPEFKEIVTPDAVFPNNWFATDSQNVWLFRMRNSSRSLEKLQIAEILPLLAEAGYQVEAVKSWNRSVIEGTGVLIFDRKFKRVYINKSQRADSHLEEFSAAIGYQPIIFETESTSGQSFYHTNVMLSIGDQFAVISPQSITPKYREKVLTNLRQGREVIQISPKQAQQEFCANVLQLKNTEGKKVLVLSEKAKNGFTQSQMDQLKKHIDIFAVFPLQVIEEVGGGSARCMVAEIFLAKNRKLMHQ